MSEIPNAASLDRVLRGTFGIGAFRAGQEEVIRALLAGKSALAVFPTGSGKSLCYQLPALFFEGVTLVVSPLIALMKDQVEKLSALGIAVARIDSTLADDEVEEVFAQIASGVIRLLYLSPERLAGSAFRKRLKGIRIPLMAIDEAHCISEWGHNFRPDYLKIAGLSRRMGVERTLALTATATVPVERDIRRNFRIAKAECFHTGVLRPNLRISVTACTEHEKDGLLMEKLREIDGPVIVYATTRNATEAIATFLQKNGFSARSYHAGLTAELRGQTQDSFMQNTTRIVVATIAFGMGIDKPDIRGVIHYHLPKCLEGYSQETGRAGRDGLPARCELLACMDDTRTLENFIHASAPSPQALKNLLDRILRMAGPGRMFAVSPYELSISHDMREETVRTVLAYLELAGIIRRGGSYHDYFRVRLLRPLESILAGLAAREKSLVRRLIAAGESGYGSLHFRLHEIQEKTGMARDKAADTIRELAAAGDIRMEQRGLREIYQMEKSRDNAVPGVIAGMSRRFDSRATYEHERILSVIAYAETRKCRAVHLSKYFGRHGTAPCGVCDLCLGGKPVKFAAGAAPAIPDDEWAAMSVLRAENHAALGTPLQMARFLCGISSPAAAKAKLQRRAEFGIWQHHRFSDILRMLEA
jgi:ATP-dependent DNA helicase RecQ